MAEFRTEHDSMGDMQVPARAYYGAQTERARRNFPISDWRFPRAFLRALGLVKLGAAQVNTELGLIDPQLGGVIETAAREVMQGDLDSHFVLDVFQTGSGTSTHMNANEVIAGRANELLGQARGGRSPVHPNDHVNLGQSSNDVIPTATHIAALESIERSLQPALSRLRDALAAKATELDTVIKLGRTHLMDATPVRLGQEFAGYATMLEHSLRRLQATRLSLSELAIGGTAVGTGLNTHLEFGARMVRRISQLSGLEFRTAASYFEALGARDAAVETSAALRGCAVSLTKIANDIRWLASGPRSGLGELLLPAVQPGSSIMPGKVNPVMAESLLQVAAAVVGNDAAISWAAAIGGNFELNVMIPLIGYKLLESISLLASACAAFTDKCVAGIQADKRRCAEYVEQSLAMCTTLAPVIGYDEAARIAKESYETGRSVRDIASQHPRWKNQPDELDRLLDPAAQTRPLATDRANGST